MYPFLANKNMVGGKPAQGFKKATGFFYFDLLFYYDGTFILGSKCICFINLSLYLCIKVVLSLLHH